MKNIGFIKSLILLALAIIITKIFILSKFGLVLGIISIIHLFFSNGVNSSLKTISKHFYKIAFVIDVLWNIVLSPVLNIVLCSFTDKYYLYGAPGETISSATGKNLNIGNTNKVLHYFAKFIDTFLGKNHCLDSQMKNNGWEEGVNQKK